ncbi:LysR family transcriptional regulator, partial [Vibrio cholerae]|uniref:LysR family transcriptional regulator n=1 Tax=Vibrio cholerae TaxID=666 RepID=UPI0018F068EA
MAINLDIQNILVLKRMYELRNVRLVAEPLGKTSGAISKTLTKMKTQFDDPLFVQTKHGFEPTTFV